MDSTSEYCHTDIIKGANKNDKDHFERIFSNENGNKNIKPRTT